MLLFPVVFCFGGTGSAPDGRLGNSDRKALAADLHRHGQGQAPVRHIDRDELRASRVEGEP
jgi:hypothetical protein